MCSSNKELNTIYMRLTDLRNLELNYGGEKDKHIVPYNYEKQKLFQIQLADI